jgi:hypothetical protein
MAGGLTNNKMATGTATTVTSIITSSPAPAVNSEGLQFKASSFVCCVADGIGVDKADGNAGIPVPQEAGLVKQLY